MPVFKSLFRKALESREFSRGLLNWYNWKFHYTLLKDQIRGEFVSKKLIAFVVVAVAALGVVFYFSQNIKPGLVNPIAEASKPIENAVAKTKTNEAKSLETSAKTNKVALNSNKEQTAEY